MNLNEISRVSPSLIAAWERDESVLYALDADFRVVYCNAAWDRFASANKGETTKSSAVQGKFVLEAFSEPLKGFYERAFRAVRQTGQTWEHCYECSSPELFRRFRMRVLFLPESDIVLVISSLEIECPHGPERQPRVFDPVFYQNRDGLISMCSSCRRTRQADAPESWDWVPHLIEKMPRNVSHGLCPVCLDYFLEMIPLPPTQAQTA